jgi:putative PD-(D/E)XK family protein DUF4420
MTAWLDILSDAWNELAQIAPVSRQYRSKLISKDVALEIRAGMRAIDNAPCLMLQTALPSDALFELSGMRLSSVPDVSGPLLVLSLEESTRRDLFLTICADVVAAAALANRREAHHQFLARLDAWRQFLRDRRDGMSRSETIGLIGELLVLERLLTTNSQGLSSWQSPVDGLHDFLSNGHALEVKTGLGPSSTITISRLDQLDIAGLRRLDLLCVRLVEALDGRSLGDIIGAVSEALPDDSNRRTFENALLRIGLLPADNFARSGPRIQLRDIQAYTVTEGFPRLIRSALPVAIAEATYALEIRAISTFSADTAAIFDIFQGDLA